jgi:hypothetical protein
MYIISDPFFPPLRSWPSYKSHLHVKSKWSKSNDLEKIKICRILLLFSDDGVRYSQQAHDLMQGFKHQVKRIFL